MAKKTEKPKLLVLLSDLHCGATAGLLPPGFVTFEGNEVKQNPFQEWLWSCWLDCWNWKAEKFGNESWSCLLNGDLTDGNHHFTKEIISPDAADHASAVVECMAERLQGAESVFLSEGTHCHVGNSEHGIAKVLQWKGVNIRESGKRKTAWPGLDLRVHGCLVSVDHHVATSARSQNESAAYAQTLADMRNRRARSGWETPKLVVRSHRHQYGCFDDGYGKMVILPPWQGKTRFTDKVVPGIVAQCGMVIADWRTVDYGEPPVIHTRLHTVEMPTPQAL